MQDGKKTSGGCAQMIYIQLKKAVNSYVTN
jgi:hypothetical protein